MRKKVAIVPGSWNAIKRIAIDILVPLQQTKHWNFFFSEDGPVLKDDPRNPYVKNNTYACFECVPWSFDRSVRFTNSSTDEQWPSMFEYILRIAVQNFRTEVSENNSGPSPNKWASRKIESKQYSRACSTTSPSTRITGMYLSSRWGMSIVDKFITAEGHPYSVWYCQCIRLEQQDSGFPRWFAWIFWQGITPHIL